jgi:hypothetical protein
VRALFVCSFLTCASLAAPGVAHAQGYAGVLLGYNYGGDAVCEGIRGCDEKHRNLGVSVGAMGRAGGFEVEWAFANELLGKTIATTSRVTTLMGNSMAGPKWGAVQPYGVIGAGLMRLHVERELSGIDLDENSFGWTGGFGVNVSLGPVMIRGDIRHFKSFQDSDFLQAVTPDDKKLDFSRVSGSLLIKF